MWLIKNKDKWFERYRLCCKTNNCLIQYAKIMNLMTLYKACCHCNLRSILIYLNRNVRKGTFGYVRPAKIQISLCIRAVWSESSLDTFRIAKDAKNIHAGNEDSNQTARMRRLIWVFVALMSDCPFPHVTVCFISLASIAVFLDISCLTTDMVIFLTIQTIQAIIHSYNTIIQY